MFAPPPRVFSARDRPPIEVMCPAVDEAIEAINLEVDAESVKEEFNAANSLEAICA